MNGHAQKNDEFAQNRFPQRAIAWDALDWEPEEEDVMTAFHSEPLKPEQAAALDRLSHLKPDQWDLFTLVVHEQSWEQMQEVLGLSHRALRQALSKLYRHLELNDANSTQIKEYYTLAQWGGWLD